MDEDVTIYTNYKEHDGVQTAMQVSREHNGRRTHQIFYTSCSNNPNLPGDFFTEQSLARAICQGHRREGQRRRSRSAAPGCCFSIKT